MHRLRDTTKVSEDHFGFMLARCTTTFFFVKKIDGFVGREKYFLMVFVELKKTRVIVLRNVLWWVLEKQELNFKNINFTKDMYKGQLLV